MDLENFIGRFHPLLVHLPIGIFIIGFIIELIFQFRPSYSTNSTKVLRLIYGAAFISALIAVLTGLFLSWTDNYELQPLNLHKYLGIVTLIFLGGLFLFTLKISKRHQKARIIFSTLALILVGITGHFGGNLTHGPDYMLKYGPKFLQPYVEQPLNENNIFKSIPADSINVYTTIVRPLIDRNCVGCHDTENSLGSLSLENFQDLKNSLKHEKLIVSGKPLESEFFRRISLPLNDEKSMPPNGNGLNFTDIQIIKYWIKNGADSICYFNSESMDSDLIALLERDYGLDYSPKPFYEKMVVDRVEDKVLQNLAELNVHANFLSETNNLLDVKFSNDSISKVQIKALNGIANQITFLKLDNCKLTLELLNELQKMPNLTKLDVANNPNIGSNLDWILKHENLETLNLNGTKVTTESLNSILNLPQLQRVYVWNTPVKSDEIKTLNNKNPNVELVSEFEFEEFEKPKPVFSAEERK